MANKLMLPRRIAIYGAGLLILALGTALFPLSRLGASALVALPVVFTSFTPLTLGQGTFCVFSLLVLLQILMEKQLRLKTLLQLPFSFVFGSLVDFYTLTLGLGHWQPASWPMRLFLVAAAIFATALGALLMVKGDLVLNAPDGFVAQFASKLEKSFGQTKLLFDFSLICVATLCGLVFTHSLPGLGIASLLAVFTVGRLIGWLEGLLFSERTKNNA